MNFKFELMNLAIIFDNILDCQQFKAGLSKYPFHDLRQTQATLLFNKFS